MSPGLPVAQISPGVGVLEGLLVLLLVIAACLSLLASAIVCSVRAWRQFRRGSGKPIRWMAAAIASLLLSLPLVSICLKVIPDRPIPHLNKRWDFTRSHNAAVIGERGDNDTYYYSGNVDLLIRLPDERTLAIRARTVSVECEQGQVKNIDVSPPRLNSVGSLRSQGETILRGLRFAPNQIDRWLTGYPASRSATISDTHSDPKVWMEADYDLQAQDSNLTIRIKWRD